jgi:aspartate/methionine/tyrosine aminotransferase
MNQEVKELNEILLAEAPVVFRLLSERGKEAFFPKKGIFAQTSEAKGKQYNATAGQAFNNDGTPLSLHSMTNHIEISDADALLYAPSYGKKELRDAWQKEILRKNHSFDGALSLPIVTAGLTHGLFLSKLLFLNDGEKIIIPDCMWGNYKLIFHGCVLNTFPSFVDTGFNVAGLKEKLMSDGVKKVVLLNFPNNPTGYTLTDSEAEEIITVFKEAASQGKEIVVVLDDAYFGLVYEKGVFRESLFAKLANLHQNILCIKIDGVSKELFAWGLRVGFFTFGWKGLSQESMDVLENKITGLVRGTVSNVCAQSQTLSLKALQSPEFSSDKERTYSVLKERYDEVRRVLDSHPEYTKQFEAMPFNSGYFMCIRLLHANADDVRRKLLEMDCGLIAMGGMLRIAYSSLPTSAIELFFEKIFSVCQ